MFYTGNVRDKAGGSTWCSGCGHRLIGRDWYQLSEWGLTPEGCCERCNLKLPGLLNRAPANGATPSTDRHGPLA